MDHMSAARIVRGLQARGGRIVHFSSVRGPGNAHTTDVHRHWHAVVQSFDVSSEFMTVSLGGLVFLLAQQTGRCGYFSCCKRVLGSQVCGGLPAPEAADNPLMYKFSWSPRVHKDFLCKEMGEFV